MTLILINEGNIVSANYMADTLRSAGYEARAADGQTEALAIYQERRPDLVLTNYYLGDGSGINFLKALKKLDPESLVVLTTGVGSERIARDCILAGAFDYVVKNVDFYKNLPVMAEDFLARHRESLREKANRDLRVRLEGQVELAGWLDHNFKNILSATMGSLALIDFSNPDQPQEKRREYLEDSLDSVKTAVNLLERLSLMDGSGEGSAGDAGRVLVSQVVDAVWEAVKEEVGRAPTEESGALSEILPKVGFSNAARNLEPQPAVYDDLFTIYHVLIMNALESLARKGDSPSITVTAGKDGPYLVSAVRDNGCGMDERTLKHAFEPLFSTKGQVGVGVSLAIARSLVLKHKGEVGAVSVPGEGSVFRFTYFTGE
ncbi:MAG: hybrid sensor histidine kinase/response regulator [Deltaproteobacteria bacterium]|nr:hybrid sensor histidine kinase/response regulator [Deltaproteobacteria bacterium]